MGNNMHLVTGFAGKTHVTAADFGAFWAAIIGSGDYVLDFGQKFAATTASNNLIRLADGELLMQGRHGRIEKGLTADLPIENGAAGTMRRDLIVARYTKSEETGVEDINPVVILGTPAESSPADPEYITGDILSGDLQRDFPLFRVNLNGSTVSSIDTLFTTIPGTIFQRLDELESDLLAVETTAKTANTTANSAVKTANAATKIKLGSYTGRGYTGTANVITVGFRPKYFELDGLVVWDDASPVKAGDASLLTVTLTTTGISLFAPLSGSSATGTQRLNAATTQKDKESTVYYWIAIG